MRFFQHAPSPLLHLTQLRAAGAAAPPAGGAAHAAVAATSSLALAALRGQQLAPVLHKVWRASLWLELLDHPDPCIRWAAIGGTRQLLGLQQAATDALMAAWLTPEQLMAAEQAWAAAETAVSVERAAWWLQGAADGAAATGDAAPAPGPQPPPAAGFVELGGLEIASRGVAAAAACAGASEQGALGHAFVHTPSTDAALAGAALALCRQQPVLLEGPPGSGKSALIAHLAAATGNDASALTIHMDDSMDAKVCVRGPVAGLGLGLGGSLPAGRGGGGP